MNAERLLAHYERIADAPDAIPRLRRFVLDLAVRGKLVPQDPNDEPGSELLKRIATEKARLVRAGEIRDKPLLPAVADTQMPFEIPALWRWVRLANIVDFSAGRTPSRNDTSYWNNGDHAWASIADMEDGQVLTTTKETVSDKARQGVFGSEPEPPGTIIMSFKLTIGKVARLGIPAFHNEAIISIRPHLADLDAYLFKVLPQFARQGDTKGAIKGATLNRDSISNILFPLPPLAEQRRIVAKVDDLMALCDRLASARVAREATRDRLTMSSLARLNAPDAETFGEDARSTLNMLPALTTRPDQIKQLRQTILNLAVCGKLVPQDPNDEPVSIDRRHDHRGLRRGVPIRVDMPPSVAEWKLPKNWESVSTAQLLRAGIFQDLKDGNHGANHPKKSEFTNQGVPFITAAQVNNHALDFDGAYKLLGKPLERLRVGFAKQGDVIFTHKGSVGRAAIAHADCLLTPQTTYYRVDHTSVCNRYLMWFLESDLFSNQYKDIVKQTTRDFLPISRQYELFHAIPPLAEQHRIVAKVDELMTLCDSLEASLTTTDDTRRRLLEALLCEALAPDEERELEAAE